LVHHGGAEGFKTLSSVKHQHERVILRYTGMMIAIPEDQQNEMVEEEQREGIPVMGGDFPTLIRELNQLRIPGEQQIIREWMRELQDINQALPNVTSSGQLTQMRESLQKLLTERSLTNARNRYKKEAVYSLSQSLARGSLLLGVNQAQLQLLKRAEQTVSITLGTMKRYNDLERLQIAWNGAIDKVIGELTHLSLALNPNYRSDRRESALKADLGDEKSKGILFADLESLKGEPYFSKAQLIIEALDPVKRLWQEREANPLSYGQMPEVLVKPLQELAIWRGRIKEEYTGVNFGKYSLS